MRLSQILKQNEEGLAIQLICFCGGKGAVIRRVNINVISYRVLPLARLQNFYKYILLEDHGFFNVFTQTDSSSVLLNETFPVSIPLVLLVAKQHIKGHTLSPD